MAKPIKVFEFIDEKEFLSITFHKKYADGMENGLITMLVIAGLLVVCLILSLIFVAGPGVIALAVLISVFLVLLALGIFKNLQAKKEIQKVRIDKESIIIERITARSNNTYRIARTQFQFLQLDDPDRADSGIEMMLLLVSPLLLLILGMAQRQASPAFYTFDGKFRFFEFGTPAQKAWVMKAIINFINRTTT